MKFTFEVFALQRTEKKCSDVNARMEVLVWSFIVKLSRKTFLSEARQPEVTMLILIWYRQGILLKGREKASLPVDMLRSKAPLLKLPLSRCSSNSIICQFLGP